MITEYIMHRFNWDAIWYAGMQTFRKSLFNNRGGRFHLGKWSGPQFDLLCLKRCKTNKEAEVWVSPGGRTILLAAVLAILKYYYLKNMERGRVLRSGWGHDGPRTTVGAPTKPNRPGR